MTARDRAIGAVCGIIAYLCWGVVALYFGLLDDRGVAPLPLLAHRVIWSVVFCLIILAAMRRHRELLRVFADPKRMLALFVSSVLIAINWLAFIYAVSEHRLTEASLGYYILPLVSVVLGLVVLREKLNRVQWLCVTLASIGVVVIVYQGQRVPWIGIAVALSFGFYGLLRKMTPGRADHRACGGDDHPAAGGVGLCGRDGDPGIVRPGHLPAADARRRDHGVAADPVRPRGAVAETEHPRVHAVHRTDDPVAGGDVRASGGAKPAGFHTHLGGVGDLLRTRGDPVAGGGKNR